MAKGEITVVVRLKRRVREVDLLRMQLTSDAATTLQADVALGLIARIDVLEAENWRLHEQLLDYENGM